MISVIIGAFFNVTFFNTTGLRQCSVFFPEKTEFISEFIRKLDCPILINVEQEPIANLDLRTPNDLIIIFNDTLNVPYFLQHTLRHHLTKIFVFVASLDDLTMLMETFWANDVISVYGVHIADGSAKVYGFEPAANGSVILITPQILKTNYSREFFRFNAHGTAVNVSFVDLPPSVIHKGTDPYFLDGMEGRIMVEVAKRFNLTARYGMPRDGIGWGWIEPEPKGAVGEVYNKSSHFAFGLMTATTERNNFLDIVVGYNPLERITWMVPKGIGPHREIWVAMLVTEFDEAAWLAITITWSVMVLAFLLIEDRKLGLALQRVFTTSLGVPTRLPKTMISRLLHVPWLWATMVLAVAYQSAMAGRLAVPPVQPDINTIHELLDSHLTISGFYNTLKILQTDDNPAIIKLSKKYVPTEFKALEAVQKIEAGEQLAYMQQSTTFQHLTLTYRNIHVMSDYALNYHDSFVLRKLSPYTKGTQGTISGLVEGGFITHWRDEFLTPPPEPPKRPSPLSLIKLLGGFIFALVGWGSALLLFVIELGCKKTFMRRFFKFN